VIDMNEMMKSIPPENKKQKKVDGVLHDTYFFLSWTGYDHPMQMIDPVSYMEIQKIQKDYYAYYEASFNVSKINPLLIFVEKFLLKRVAIPANSKQLENKAPGDFYYIIHKKGEKIILDKEITLEDTINLKEYAHIVLVDNQKITISELVQKNFEWSCAYEYDDRGLLLKVIMKNDTEGTKILEKGNGL
jgi:hypothetical protein